MNGTLYLVVNGRMVKAACKYPGGDAMDVDYYDHKHGRIQSATRYTRRALQRADHLGTLPKRLARQVGRTRPTAA